MMEFTRQEDKLKVEAQYKIAEIYRAEGNYAKAKEEFAKIQQMEDALGEG